MKWIANTVSTIGLFLSIGGCGFDLNGSRHVIGSPGTNLSYRYLTPQISSKLETYASCQALREDFDLRIGAYNANQLESNLKNGAGTPETCGDVEVPVEINPNETSQASITNLQEKGIDEADYVKRNAFHIYVLHDHTVEVIHAQTLKAIGKIKIKEFFGDSLEPKRMYTHGSRLVILGTRSLGGETSSKVLIYQTSAFAMPELVEDIELDGALNNSRLVDGRIFVISGAQTPIIYQDVQGQPAFASVDLKFEGDKFNGIPCTDYVKPAANDMNFTYTAIYSLDITSSHVKDTIQSTALMGLDAGKNVYVGSKHIVLFQDRFEFRNFDQTELMFMPQIPQKSIITQVAYDSNSGSIRPTARGEIPGYLPKGQWSMKELDDQTLAVVSTTRSSLVEEFQGENLVEGRNHLFLLQRNQADLGIIGQVRNYGKPNEDIKSVRFEGDLAYIVTFFTTDPLYTIDLRDRFAPKVVSKLEMPGFSTYMQPVSDKWLVGIGYGATEQGFAQGIQISLFGVNDTTQKLDQRIMGERGSSSEATWNHHAFFANNESLNFVVPLVLVKNFESWFYPSELDFSGAIVFEIQETEGGQLVEKARLSHQDLGAQRGSWTWWNNAFESYDINRIFKHQGSVISVSKVGLKVHDEDTYETTSSLIWVE